MEINKKLLLILSLLLLSCSSENPVDPINLTGYSSESLVHDGLQRQYLIYLPSSYQENTSYPLVINFHGFGGQINEYSSYADMRSLADSENFILVYPQGENLNGSPHWNAALMGGNNKSDIDDLGFIESLILKLSSQNIINSDRVYMVGYSNGGMMSYAMACHKSNLVAAIASVSGTMLYISNCEPNRSIPLLNIHGTEDPTLPYNGNNYYNSVDDALNFWNTNNNSDPSPNTTLLNTNLNNIQFFGFSNSDNISVDHYKIINGGHVWFDININGKNTSELVWEFFSKYDINGRIDTNQ